MRLVVAILFTLVCLLDPAARADDPPTVTIPFSLLVTKHIVIPIKVNGKGPYRVIFDTGAPVNLFNTKIGRAAGLIGKESALPLLGLLRGGGQMSIDSLQIGDIKTRNVPVVVMDHPTLETISQLFGPIDGIVGFPFFARYRLVIDYQKRQLQAAPNGYDPPDVFKTLVTIAMSLGAEPEQKPKVISAAGQWGLVLAKNSDTTLPGVTVARVLPESAAAKGGIREGDRILTLDGRWTDSIIDAFQAAAHIKPGQEVIVEIERADKRLKLLVTPRRGI